MNSDDNSILRGLDTTTREPAKVTQSRLWQTAFFLSLVLATGAPAIGRFLFGVPPDMNTAAVQGVALAGMLLLQYKARAVRIQFLIALFLVPVACFLFFYFM